MHCRIDHILGKRSFHSKLSALCWCFHSSNRFYWNRSIVPPRAKINPSILNPIPLWFIVKTLVSEKKLLFIFLVLNEYEAKNRKKKTRRQLKQQGRKKNRKVRDCTVNISCFYLLSLNITRNNDEKPFEK